MGQVTLLEVYAAVCRPLQLLCMHFINLGGRLLELSGHVHGVGLPHDIGPVSVLSQLALIGRAYLLDCVVYFLIGLGVFPPDLRHFCLLLGSGHSELVFTVAYPLIVDVGGVVVVEHLLSGGGEIWKVSGLNLVRNCAIGIGSGGLLEGLL